MRPKKDPTENETQLGNLLERYKKLIKPPQASVEKEAIIVIKELTDITLLPQQLSYTVSTRTLSIKAPSVLRSELFQHRSRILEGLHLRLGAQNAPHTIL